MLNLLVTPWTDKQCVCVCVCVHTNSVLRSSMPARISMSNTRNSFEIVPTLFTTVFAFLFFCRMTQLPFRDGTIVVSTISISIPSPSPIPLATYLQENFSNDLSIRQLLVSKIQMDDVSNGFKARRHINGLWQDSTKYFIYSNAGNTLTPSPSPSPSPQCVSNLPALR